MIAWFIVGVLGIIALWVLVALAESILRLTLAILERPKPPNDPPETPS